MNSYLSLVGYQEQIHADGENRNGKGYQKVNEQSKYISQIKIIDKLLCLYYSVGT
jgi:hypothetical protein